MHYDLKLIHGQEMQPIQVGAAQPMRNESQLR